MGEWQPDALASHLNEAQLAKLEADFKLLEAVLSSEQLEFLAYQAKLAEYNETTQVVLTTARERAADQREAAVNSHLLDNIVAEALPARAGFAAQTNQIFQTFCNAAPRKDPGQVLRVNIISCPALGGHFSLYMESLVSLVAAEITAQPRTTCALVLLPNTPIWGTGVAPGSRDAVLDLVDTAQHQVSEAFKGTAGVKVKMVTGKFQADSIKSPIREWRIDLLMVISDSTLPDGDRKPTPISIFAKSAYWVRRTLAKDFKALDRSQFRNWASEVLLDDMAGDWSNEHSSTSAGASSGTSC